MVAFRDDGGNLHHLLQGTEQKDPGMLPGICIGRGLGRISGGCRLCLSLHPPEQIQNFTGRVLSKERIGFLSVLFRNGRSKPGKAGVQLFRILHLGNDQNNTLGIQRNSFYHKRNILGLKSKFTICLLHHITEQGLCFLRSIGELADFQFAASQIFSGQSAANLVLINFFYFHTTTLSFLHS